MTKLWGGRFTRDTDASVEEFTSSISFDQRMYRQDILGSMAHARMLGRCGILTQMETDTIIAGLTSILADIEAGNFSFEIALEDIHMNIEKRLTERIGPVGGKLHTARSRNDQVALDTHMYMKSAIQSIASLLHSMEKALLEVAEININVILPGYTHLQRAQPVLFSHHLLAYFHMLSRDFDRLRGVWDRTDIMPLGAGALAGTTFHIDRRMVADELKFSRIYANSMDA
ncbi:MAG: Argininosuccinate lyase, partial [Firmicutes bacterium]|nr:Argininosuccinate lyase [Bacillota bacterium]